MKKTTTKQNTFSPISLSSILEAWHYFIFMKVNVGTTPVFWTRDTITCFCPAVISVTFCFGPWHAPSTFCYTMTFPPAPFTAFPRLLSAATWDAGAESKRFCTVCSHSFPTLWQDTPPPLLPHWVTILLYSLPTELVKTIILFYYLATFTIKETSTQGDSKGVPLSADRD